MLPPQCQSKIIYTLLTSNKMISFHNIEDYIWNEDYIADEIMIDFINWRNLHWTFIDCPSRFWQIFVLSPATMQLWHPRVIKKIWLQFNNVAIFQCRMVKLFVICKRIFGVATKQSNDITEKQWQCRHLYHFDFTSDCSLKL